MEKEELERLAGERLRLSFEDIVSHPRISEARRDYISGFLNVYEGDPFLVRLLLEAGRFLVFHSAAVLEAAQDPSRRETWFTVAALKRQLGMFGYASARQVDHLLARLCEVGFITRSRSPDDKRVQLLATTDKLRSHHTRWLAAHFAHAAGPLIQNAILKSAMDSGDPRASISYLDVADRFGVSRTHIRNLMSSAQSAGLVRIVGNGGRLIEILPRHWESYDRGLAVGMYLHDAVNLVAMRAWTLQQRGEVRQMAS
jgi:DNA-binding MarR family transcriptional regulator